MPKGEPTIWSRLTPLNRALSLVLLVGVPFFLLLLIMVIACALKSETVNISLREENRDLSNYFYKAPKSYMNNNRRRYHEQSDDDDDITYDYPQVDPNIFRRKYTPSRRKYEDYDSGFNRFRFEEPETTAGSIIVSRTTTPTTNHNLTDVISPSENSTRSKREIPSGNYFYKAKGRTDECVCEDECGPDVKNPYVVALNEITFVDDPDDEDFRYKCTGAIVSENLVLVSAECISDTERSPSFYQIKAGTNIWSSEDASTHTIDNIIKSSDDNGLVLLKLKQNLPLYKAIRTTTTKPYRSGSSLELEIWNWDTSSIMPLQWRSKNAILGKKLVSFTNCEQCGSKPCLREELTHVCSEYYYTSGNPVFHGEDLVGMQTGLYCIDDYVAARCYETFTESITGWINQNV